MRLGNNLKIYPVAMMLLAVSQMAFAQEWWQGVIILDMTCSDDEQSVDKRRTLLLKLDDNKLLRYPENQVLQRCSELEGNPRN